MATEVVRYVDTNASGAGDGTSWTDAYTTLGAWNTSEAVNLITADQFHTVYCRASAGTSDTSVVTISSWTTDETHYITIEAASTDYAIKTGWDATRYNHNGTLSIRENYTRLIGLQLTGASALGFTPTTGSGFILVKDCRIKGTSTRAVYGTSGTTAVIQQFENTIVTDATSTSVRLYAGTINIFNCVIYGRDSPIGTGLDVDTASIVTIKNSVFAGHTTSFDYASSTVDLSYTYSPEGEGTNPVYASGSDIINEFEDYTTRDFTLLYTGNFFHAGDPVSGLVYDIENDLWDSTSPSIGVDELIDDGTAHGSVNTVSIDTVLFAPVGSQTGGAVGSVAAIVINDIVTDPSGTYSPFDDSGSVSVIYADITPYTVFGYDGSGPATVTWYVDTGATGAGTGLNWTDAYTSLSAFLTAEVINLVTADVNYHVYCRASTGVADTSNVLFAVDWATDSDHQLIIEAANTDWALISGYSSSIYRLFCDISVRTGYVQLLRLQFYESLMTTGSVPNIGKLTIRNCRFHDLNRGIYQTTAKYTFEYFIENTIFSLVGLDAITSYGCIMTMNNCVLHGGSSDGIEITNPSVVTINNTVVIGFPDSFDFASGSTVTINNCSSLQNEGINPITPSGGNLINEFPGYASYDYTLVDTGNFYHGGIPVLGLLYDMDGDPYYSSSPSIGVDELADLGNASGSVSTIIIEDSMYGLSGSYIASASGSVDMISNTVTVYAPVGSVIGNASGSISYQSVENIAYDPVGAAGVGAYGGTVFQIENYSVYDTIGAASSNGVTTLVIFEITLFNPVGSAAVQGSVAYQGVVNTLFSVGGSVFTPANGSVSVVYEGVQLFDLTGVASVSGAISYETDQVIVYDLTGSYVANVSGLIAFSELQSIVYNPVGVTGFGSQGSISFQVETLLLFDLFGGLSEVIPLVPWAVKGRLPGAPTMGRVDILSPSIAASSIVIVAPVPVTSELAPTIQAASSPVNPVSLIQSIPVIGVSVVGVAKIIKSPDIVVGDKVTPDIRSTDEIEKLKPKIVNPIEPY